MAIVNRWQVTTADEFSWTKIATNLGATREQLWAANGLSAYRPLVLGELLKLPLG